MKDKKVYIATLGSGKGSENPVQKPIEDLKPSLVVLIAGSDSRKDGMVEKVLSCCPDTKSEILSLNDINNPDETYKKVFEKIRTLITEGYVSSNIYINYTAGTKAMSVGLAFAGKTAGCDKFYYVGGSKRESSAGRVKKGFEQIFSSGLPFLTIDQEIKNAEKYFNLCEFIAARVCLGKLDEKFGLISDEDEYTVFIGNIVEGYHLWQLGDYEGAAGKLKDVRVPENTGKEFKEQLDSNKEILNRMLVKTQLQVFDRAAAALRTAEKGYYSFAAEDIYSSLEYMAAYILKKHGVDKSSVDPEELGKKGITVSDFMTKKAGIGLFDAFRLAERLGDEVGKTFIEDKKIFDALKTRNEFIHQGKPVKKEDAYNFYNTSKPYYEKFLEKYGDIKESNLDKLMEKFRFPVL